MSESLKSFDLNEENEIDVQQQLCHHVGQAIGFDDTDVLFSHQTDSETVDQGKTFNKRLIRIHFDC